MKKHLLKSLLALALVLITGNVWGETIPQTSTFAEKQFSELADGDVVIFASSKKIAMSNATQTTGKPNQIGISISGTGNSLAITPETGDLAGIAWSIKAVDNGFTFYQYGSTSNRLCITVTNSNTAAKVTDANSSYTTMCMGSDGKNMQFYGATRFLGCYTSGSDWRTYNTEGATNYGGTTTKFYVLNPATPSTDPSISADNVTIEADATSGEIAYTITNPVDGQNVTASTTTDWISDFQYGDGTVTFTTAANTGAEREGVITLSYEGANDKEVTVTQKKATTFASLEALVAAGEPTTAGETVTVTLADEVITKFYTSSTDATKRNGVYLQAGSKEIEIYCSNVPNSWIEGGTISGTLENCTWKNYNGTWELCPGNWNELTYSAPQTYTITIDENIANGTVSANATEAAAGVEVTLTVTPENHYLLDALTVTDASSNLVTVTDNKFMMPASNVTISAEFVEKTKYQVIYANTQGFEMVYEGEKANVPVLESLRGWDFAGWTTALNYTASTTAPTLFDGTVTGNTTLVAVYKKTEAGVGNPEWRKVTSEPADWSGKYLIVFEGDVVNDVTVTPKAFNGSLTTLDVTNNGLDVTISDNVIAINSDNEDAYFTIAKSGTGYSITSESGCTIGNVLNTKGEAQNALKTGDYVNSISLEDDNSVKIGCASSTLQFNANSDQLRFRYFKSINQKPIYLYKYVTGDATTYSLYPSYTVNISSVGFATFYCKKAVTIPEGVTAYYAAYENKTITLNQVQGEVIHQGEGVVLKGEEGSYEFVPTSDVMEDAPNNALFGKEVESEYADLVDDDTYVYTLNVGSNGVSFYHMAESSSLAANRAYMLIPVADFEDGAETIGFRFGDATQIENVNAAKADKYFDLMGREVLNPAGGIYILNGKKVLIK